MIGVMLACVLMQSEDAPQVLHLSVGTHVLTEPILIGRGSTVRAIRGAGPHITRVVPPLGQPAIRVIGWGRQALDERQEIDPQTAFFGCEVSGLSIHGTRGEGQTGIAVSGDAVRIRDVEVWRCDTGFRSGDDHGTWRESSVIGLHVRHCGIGVELRQRSEFQSGDGQNNLSFGHCIVSYCDRGVLIHNEASDRETMRGIYWQGLIHGRKDGGTGPLIEITGRVRDVELAGRVVQSGHESLLRLSQVGRYSPGGVRMPAWRANETGRE